MPTRLSPPTTASRPALALGLIGCGVSIAAWVLAALGPAADLSTRACDLFACIAATSTISSVAALLAWRLDIASTQRADQLSAQYADLDGQVKVIAQNQTAILSGLERADEVRRNQSNEEFASGYELGRASVGGKVIPHPRPYITN